MKRLRTVANSSHKRFGSVLKTFVVLSTVVIIMVYIHAFSSREITPMRMNSIAQQMTDQIQRLNSIERKLNDLKRSQGNVQIITNSTCQPTKNVAFAKTHKTGSSTLQNILLRYGVKNDLNFAFPGDSWMFSIIEPFNASLVLDGPFKDLELNMFVSHSMWRQKEVEKILPKSKTKYITLLRDPVDCFESNYVFMGAQNKYKMDINGFAKKYAAQGIKRPKKAYVGQNNLLFDMGLEIDDMDDMTSVKAKVDAIDQDFDLVLISEMFDESVILLQDELCWSLEDMTYIRQLERVQSEKTPITPESRQILKEWLWADYILYDYFVARLNESLENFGQNRLETRLQELKALNEKITKECVVKKADKSELTGEASKGIKGVYGLQVNEANPWCLPYVRRETEFAKMIRDYQKEKVRRLGLLRGKSEQKK